MNSSIFCLYPQHYGGVIFEGDSGGEEFPNYTSQVVSIEKSGQVQCGFWGAQLQLDTVLCLVFFI